MLKQIAVSNTISDEYTAAIVSANDAVMSNCISELNQQAVDLTLNYTNADIALSNTLTASFNSADTALSSDNVIVKAKGGIFISSGGIVTTFWYNSY